MERKVGEKFKDGDNLIKVYKSEDGSCTQCFYGDESNCTKALGLVGYCAAEMRDDDENVLFKIVKK